jgi:N-acetyl-gamma-glutamyl-phosphate reductase
MKIKAGIVGGAGYTARRYPHPTAPHLRGVGRHRQLLKRGQPVHQVHDDLVGETDLVLLRN